MAELRDYREWHKHYDDPASGLSWRLTTVRERIATFLDERLAEDAGGDVRILSVCAGDGRDVLGVLAGRADRDRVHVTLVEVDVELSDRARTAAAELGVDTDVRTADAGRTDAYVGAVPADLVLLVGIFGNISLDDIERTVGCVAQLCAPGATVLWSRSRDRADHNTEIRGWFAAAGCTELDYSTYDGADGRDVSLATVRFDGVSAPLVPGQSLFTFVR